MVDSWIYFVRMIEEQRHCFNLLNPLSIKEMLVSKYVVWPGLLSKISIIAAATIWCCNNNSGYYFPSNFVLDVLVQALFFARWCNRDHTLTKIDSSLLHSGSKIEKNWKNINFFLYLWYIWNCIFFSILEHCEAI